MKKTALTLLVILVAIGCKNGDSTIEEKVITAEETAEITEEEKEGQLLGQIEKQELQEGSYANWYELNHDDLIADEEVIKEIDQYIHDYEILVFMGTWCSDSQREIPQFFNLLEKVDFDEEKMTLYAVNEDKELPSNEHTKYNVEYVPTIIFLKDGKEVNRFVEYAQESLAHDVLKIVKGEEYQNPYAE